MVKHDLMVDEVTASSQSREIAGRGGGGFFSEGQVGRI